MAGGWVLMREDLADDPKTISMASRLAADPEFVAWISGGKATGSAHAHVPRNVTVAVCVAALLRIWSQARRKGMSDGADMLLRHCTLDTLSHLTNTPGIGVAMASVGWAVEEEMADGTSGVRLPNFMAEGILSQDKARIQAAERQRKFRNRRGSGAPDQAEASSDDSNVTVTLPVTLPSRKSNAPEERRGEESVGKNPHNPSCSEVENPPPEQAEPHAVGEVVLTFPTNGKPASWDLLASQVAEWQEIFPGLDVEAQCREALGWVKANNRRKKTAGGMRRFLYAWLQRENDAPAARRSHANPKPAETPNERLARLRGANALQQSASEKE